MQEFITKFDGAKVRFSDLNGDKTPIVFIHGWGCAGSFDYAQCVSESALAGHRRILIDTLGAGYSDKPVNFDYSPTSHAEYICDLIENLGLKECVLCGHSLGGRIALAAAEILGERIVKGIILIEASLEPDFLPYIDEGEDKFIKDNRAKFEADLKNESDERFLATFRAWSSQALYKSAVELMDENSHKWAVKAYESEVKIVFIAGEASEDKAFNLKEIKNAGIQVIYVKNATHAMIWEAAKDTAEAINNAISYILKDTL